MHLRETREITAVVQCDILFFRATIIDTSGQCKSSTPSLDNTCAIFYTPMEQRVEEKKTAIALHEIGRNLGDTHNKAVGKLWPNG